MTSTVHRADTFDRLVGRLVDEIEGRTEGMDRLARWRQPVRVLVPNLTTGDYLELAVAEHVHDAYAEAAVGYEFETLQDVLTERIEAAAPDEGDDSFEVLDRHDLKTMLVEVLDELEEEPSEESLQPVADYLTADEAGSADEEGRALTGEDADFARRTRRYQLAARLGALFEEYSFSRRGWLDAWAAGESVEALGEADAGRTPEWEAELWRRVDERRSQGETERLLLHEAFERVDDELVGSLTDELRDGTLHAFGFESFGDTFLEILDDLGDSEDLDVAFYIYSPGGKRFVEEATEPEDGDELLGPVDEDHPLADCHPALQQWGRIGAESLWQLDGVADPDDMEDLSQGEAELGETWLEALQASIRGGTDADIEGFVPDVDASEDDSIRIVRAPDLRREVEIVANRIWHAVADDEELNFSDVAVAIPEAQHERYRAHVEAVFDQFHDLPYTVNNMPLAGDSPVRDAAEALLELPVEPFDREQILSLATHPNVRGRFDEVETDRWGEWVEELNILYGEDSDDQGHNGRHYLDEEDADLYNWDQGLKRLAFGAARDVADEPGEARIEVDGQAYFPEGVGLSEWDEASAMVTLINSLIEDAKWLRGHRATLEEWSEVFSELIDTYLVPNDDAGADYTTDQRDIARIRTALGKLGERPSIGKVPFRVAQLQAFDRLERLTEASASGFTEGVVVTTPDRVRGIPFEHTFVLGLGEGAYPSTDDRSDIDLRLDARQVGDVRASDRDVYHFLEMVQSTGDTLTLSWVGRDAASGDDLPASLLVEDLKRMLPVDAQGDELVDVHPLHRYDRHAGYFDPLPSDGRPGAKDVSDDLASNLHPEAFREAQMDALRELLEASGDGDRRREVWTGEAFLDAQRRLRETRDVSSRDTPPVRMNEPDAYDPETHTLDRRPPEREELPNTIRISQLAKFLKSPLQAKAQHMLGMYEDDEDATGERVEPMELGHLEKAIIGREVGRRGLESRELGVREALENRWREVSEEKFAPGDLPKGPFGQAASEVVVNDFEDSENDFSDHFTGSLELELSSTETRRHVFSTVPDKEEHTAVTVTISLPAHESSLKFDIVGQTPTVVTSPSASHPPTFVRITSKSKSKARREKEFLRGYLSHLLLSAGQNDRSDTKRRAVVVPSHGWSDGPQSGTVESFVRHFPKISHTEAREQLRRLITHMLKSVEVSLLPIDVLGDTPPEDMSQKELFEKAKDEDSGNWSSIQTQYGPLERYFDYLPPDSLLDTIERRFKYFPSLPVSEDES